MKRLAAGAAAIALAMSTTVLAARAGPDPLSAGGIVGPATASALAVRLHPPAAGPSFAGCPMFPADHPYNVPIDSAPVAANSSAIIANVQRAGNAAAGQNLHPDFGENPIYGARINVVGPGQPLVPIRYTQYPQESDPGPYPIPDNAEIQQGEDRHMAIFDVPNCRLTEFYLAGRDGQGWYASNGASWDTRVWQPRPVRWTAANAAGLPGFPITARCDEMVNGHIDHAIGMGMSIVGPGFIAPASHSGPNTSAADVPVNGMRFRLRADFDTSSYTGQAKVLLETFKHYGLIVVDIGVSWYFGGVTGDCWKDAELTQLYRVPGTAFEVVDTGPVQI